MNLDQQIISLWWNGLPIEKIAEKTDCTIDYVNDIINTEIFYELQQDQLIRT